MEEKRKDDRRSRYTRQTIKDIFLEELKTKPYNKKQNCTYPFCKKIQSSPRYQVLFSDDVVSARMLEKFSDMGKESFITHLMQKSLLTFEQAEAVFWFQMNGCLAINRMMLKNKCTDWSRIQQTADQFIRAGLETFLIHDQREEFCNDQ